MGQKSFTCQCCGVGDKGKLKKIQTEFHKKVCNEEVLEEITETAPPKKRKCAETTLRKKKKGGKEATILCVTKLPAEQVFSHHHPQPAVGLEEPLPDTPSPEISIQHTLPPNNDIAQPVFALDLQRIYNGVSGTKVHFTSSWGFFAQTVYGSSSNARFASSPDCWAARQAWQARIPARSYTRCLLSPAVGMNYREAFVTSKICLHSSTALQLHGVISLHWNQLLM